MDIEEACDEVAHQHPEPHHIPPNLAAVKSTRGTVSNTTDLVQNLMQKLGMPSRHPVQHSAGPAWRTGVLCPNPGDFFGQPRLPARIIGSPC